MLAESPAFWFMIKRLQGGCNYISVHEVSNEKSKNAASNSASHLALSLSFIFPFAIVIVFSFFLCIQHIHDVLVWLRRCTNFHPFFFRRPFSIIWILFSYFVVSHFFLGSDFGTIAYRLNHGLRAYRKGFSLSRVSLDFDTNEIIIWLARYAARYRISGIAKFLLTFWLHFFLYSG